MTGDWLVQFFQNGEAFHSETIDGVESRPHGKRFPLREGIRKVQELRSRGFIVRLVRFDGTVHPDFGYPNQEKKQ